MTATPSVARQDGQDGVVLALTGEWIVSAGHQLEAAGTSLISLAKDAKRVILDLAEGQCLLACYQRSHDQTVCRTADDR